MSALITLFFANVLVSNVVLTKFLGICPLLGVSRKTSSAIGMGLAVVFVIFGSSVLTYVLYYNVLVPLSLEYMDLITFILVIAAFVQFVEMVLKKYSVPLYKALGIYLPLITTNCVVLFVTLDNIIKGFDFVEMVVYSLAVPTGFMLVLYIFATIRERLDQSNIPEAFKGNPIALIVAAVMAAVFGSLAGLV
jgi:Na+-translocating ferredoxin:NAD+ oxidoreductase subunit A